MFPQAELIPDAMP